MPLRDESIDSYVWALRSEGRLRGWYAIIFSGTIGTLYLSSAFPFTFDLFPWAKSASNFVTGTIIFLSGLMLVWAAERIRMRRRVRTAGISILRATPVRRLLRELNSTFGIRVAAVAVGNNNTGNVAATHIGHHRVVAIGRGALPLIVRDPAAFRYRMAHEYAHLAGGDPARERWVRIVFFTALTCLAVSYGGALVKTAEVVADNWRVMGWRAALEALAGWMLFGIEANFALFGSIFLMLFMERSSAARLVEFYADAAAARAVGAIPEAFATTSPRPRGLKWLWAAMFAHHPAPATRATAAGDHTAVYRADMMLFALQGFFGAFIIEIVLQLLFASASAGLASFEDRRASVARYLEISQVVVVSEIAVGAVLAGTAFFLLLNRLSTMLQLDVGDRPETTRFLLLSAPVFTLAGALFLLATSTGVQWDLQQTGWSLSRYASVAWDRLAIHAVSLLSLCISIGIVAILKPQRRAVIFALSATPVGAALALGCWLYSS